MSFEWKGMNMISHCVKISFIFLAAKEEFLKTKLPNSVLSKVWNLADVDNDGLLDRDEFALAMYLAKIKLEGAELPTTLPEHLIPPSKHNETVSNESIRLSAPHTSVEQ